MKDLISEYSQKKDKIKERLNDFANIHRSSDEDIFPELCFCILTPQSKAVYCDEAIKELVRSRLLFKGNAKAIRNKLQKVRFPNNKANYLVEARNNLKKGNKIEIKNKLLGQDPAKIREWLVDNVKGLGYKEASHFLRNIGLGGNMAILDTHILKNLKRYKVIDEVPKALTKRKYFEIEKKMKGFSRRIKIPIEELDLLFWSRQTGFIFK